MGIRFEDAAIYIRGELDLSPLAIALCNSSLAPIDVLAFPGGFSIQVLQTIGDEFTPVSALQKILTVVEDMGQPTRNLWDSCSKRIFQLGYEVGDFESAIVTQFEPGLIARISAAGGSLQITIYEHREDDYSVD